MANIALPFTFSPSTLIKSSDVNSDLAEVQSKFNTYAVQTDVAKTITVTHTFTANQTMSGGITGNVTGNATGNAGTATKLAAATTINGVSFDGSAPITVAAAAGTLTGATLAAGVTASSLTSVGVLASPHMTGAVVDSGGLTVTAGGAAVTGNSSVTGNLSVVGVVSGGVQAVAQTTLASTTGTTLLNSSLTIAVGANQSWKIDFDLSVTCDNVGGVNLALSSPAGATGNSLYFGAIGSATALESAASRSINGSLRAGGFSTFNSVANPVPVRVSAYIATAASAGSVTLQYAAVTAGQTAAVQPSSTMLATRIS